MILPFVRDIFLGLEQSASFRAMQAALAPERGRARTAGLTETARALYTALLSRATGRPLLLLTADNRTAESLHDLLTAFQEYISPATAPVLFPAHDLLPSDGLSPHPDISEKRAIALWKMARGQASLVVAPVAAVAMRLEPPSFYANLALHIRRGDAMDLEMLASHLLSVGYVRREPVDMVGQFSVRGGIVDVFSPETPRPVRLELFGDEVDSIREFDAATQRSVAPRQETILLPLTDFPVRPDLLRELDESSQGQPFPVPSVLSTK